MGEESNPIFFETPSELRAWFEKHHDLENELWVGYYKKGTKRPTITWSESVDEALCFGWIDGVRKSVDEIRYKIRFSPRKPASIWSKINIEKIEKLTAEGKMTKAGLEKVKQAKESGSWDSAYRLKETMEIPADLEAALKKNPKAWENFQHYSNSNKFIFIRRVDKVKGAELRAEKIKRAVELIKKNLKPNDRNRKPLI